MDGPYRSPSRARRELRSCPRCQEPTLAERAVGPTAVLECGRCYGLWLDASAIADLVIETDRQAAVLALPPSPGRAERGERYLACPRCRAQMVRKAFARTSGVVIDVCRRHGAWFDAGELRIAIAYLAAKAPASSDHAPRRPEAARELSGREMHAVLFPRRSWLERFADLFFADRPS